MARLPIKTFGDGIQAWIYAKDDPHTARIAKLPTMEAAEERGKEIARVLTDAWRGEDGD